MRKVYQLPFIVLLITLLTGLNAGAQVKFTTVSSSQEIGRNEYLQIQFMVENAKSIDRMTPPSFEGFRIVEGPIQSSGMSVVNGNMSQYKGVSFVLQPVKTGKFRIPGATATIDGNPMHSNPVTVTVSATGSGSQHGAANPNMNPFFQQGWPDPMAASAEEEPEKDYVLKPGENVREKIRKNLFVKVEVNKPACYVGEPIVATYKLYSRLRSESRVTIRPSLNGFSVYDMVDPNSDVPSVEKVNGKSFTVHIIRKAQLIPLQAGTIELDTMEIENTIHFLKASRKPAKDRHRPADLFDAFEDDDAVTNWVDENAVLDTKPLAVTVKPLPETNKPLNYNGAVGQFTVEASLDNRNPASRDQATLQVVIRGSGNLPVINAPKVKWPAGLEAYDPVAKEEVDHTQFPMRGSKIFKYVFSPNAPGLYTIPSIEFSYFDPTSQVYRTVHSDSLVCKAGPALKKSLSQSSEGSDSSSLTAGGRAGGFIHLHLAWIFAILIFTALGIYLWRQNARIIKPGEKPAEKRVRKEVPPTSPKDARPDPLGMPVAKADPLLPAREMITQTNYKGFYQEVNRALWKAVSDKFQLPASELNKSNMIKALEARGWDPENILLLEKTFTECEMNVYTPVYDIYNMQQVLMQAERLIGKM